MLQSFHFFPLQPKHTEVYDSLLKRQNEIPLKASALGFKRTAVTLRILEARGLVRVRTGKMGKSRRVLIIEEVR